MRRRFSSYQNFDLVTGVYEGGLKLWEGSIDLVTALQIEVENGHLSLTEKRVFESFFLVLIHDTTSGNSCGISVQMPLIHVLVKEQLGDPSRDEVDVKAITRLFAVMGDLYVELIATGSDETMMIVSSSLCAASIDCVLCCCCWLR